MMNRLIGLLFLASSLSAQATGVDISLSNKTAKFAYLTESGSLGYAGADIGYSYFYNESGDTLFGARILVVGNAVGAKRAIQYGFGAKANFGTISSGNTAFSAVGIGGTLRYLFPSQNPIGLTVEMFTSPAITSFGSTKNVFESSVRLDIEVMPNTRGYVGLRTVEVEHSAFAVKQKLEDTLVFGVRLSF